MIISLIPGISLKTRKNFADAGLNTIDDLYSCKSDLLNIRGVGKKKAHAHMTSCKALIEDRPVRKTHEKIALPVRETEIFLDLEGLDMRVMPEDMDGQTDYLIEALVRRGEDEEYVPFVAHKKSGEKKMLQDFVKFMKKQDDYVMYHWHHYERTHLAKMMEKHGIGLESQDLVMSDDTLVDLYKIATAAFAFPTYDNSIKSIAKWMGFEWTREDVNAMSSISLYQEYLEDPKLNRDKLDLILDYNRDDCVAARVVKDWLCLPIMNNCVLDASSLDTR